MVDPVIARRLAFLAPGFLHGLGNALFAIHGQAQVMESRLRGELPPHADEPSTDEPGAAEDEPDRADAVGRVREILTASSNAQAALNLYRTLSLRFASEEEETIAASTALRAVLDQARIALRDQGLTVDIDIREDLSGLERDAVPKHTFVSGLLDAIIELHDAVPTAYRGSLRFALESPDALLIELIDSPGQLPFDIDLSPAVRAAADVFDHVRVSESALAEPVEFGVEQVARRGMRISWRSSSRRQQEIDGRH